MSNDFLREKKALLKRKAIGDISTAASIAGVNVVVFYKWTKIKTLWPSVDQRNYVALSKAINSRERNLINAIKEHKLGVSQNTPASDIIELMEIAISNILESPHGCVFCDCGTLRDPEKSHEDDCGFYLAKQIINFKNQQHEV